MSLKVGSLREATEKVVLGAAGRHPVHVALRVLAPWVGQRGSKEQWEPVGSS